MKHLFTVGLALCAGSACTSTPATPTPTAQISTLSTELDWSAFPLGPQDIVRVGVYGHGDLGTSGGRVDMEGNLSLPLVGPVKVAGLSVSQARLAITAAYAQFVKDPRVDVSIVNHSARRFYVLGEVARPGSLELERPLNVMQAMALAGGFTS